MMIHLKEPTKYIGKRYTKQEADEMTTDFGWYFKEQEEGKYRRVVPLQCQITLCTGNQLKHWLTEVPL